MNNYNDVSREGLEDMLEEATEEIGILRKRMKEFKQVEANYDALQSPMPCGHLARYAVNGEDGTQYCCMCEMVSTKEELNKYIKFFNEIEWCGDPNKFVCPDCGNYKEQGHRYSCRYRIFRGEQ